MNNYIITSLELHLFFARIMKEHSLFLEAGFTQQCPEFINRAEQLKQQFETLLLQAINLSDGIVSCEVINSEELVTEFTCKAEKLTQQFTGICINQKVTQLEKQLRSDLKICSNNRTLNMEVRKLNRTSIRLLNELIKLKENILENVLSCSMFTMNYPLLIKHILREAKLYRNYVIMLENGKDISSIDMRQTEQFWNQIMMEHALFIRQLLDPSENELITTSNSFAIDYDDLLKKSREMNDRTILQNSLQKTIQFKEFKSAGTSGINNCKIQSIILPLLADHVLREANHYIRLLS